MDAKRLVRIGLQEKRVLSTEDFRHVTFAEFGRQTGGKHPGLIHFEHIPTDFGLQIKERSSGFHHEIRDMDGFMVGHDTPFGAHEFQARTFLEHEFSDVGTNVPAAIVNGIHLQAHIFKKNVLADAVRQFRLVDTERTDEIGRLLQVDFTIFQLRFRQFCPQEEAVLRHFQRKPNVFQFNLVQQDFPIKRLRSRCIGVFDVFERQRNVRVFHRKLVDSSRFG